MIIGATFGQKYNFGRIWDSWSTIICPRPLKFIANNLWSDQIRDIPSPIGVVRLTLHCYAKSTMFLALFYCDKNNIFLP